MDPQEHMEYAERVLSFVERVPRGRVTTYGAVADAVGGSPRQVGQVMSREGGGVPWWRVVRADGTLPEPLREEATEHYREEGTALRPGGAVDLRSAFWAGAGQAAS